MGTDVYLEWDGMSKEEENARITGFSIDAGGVGYLRASFGMPAENEVLHALFPETVWKADEPVVYDFGGNAGALKRVVAQYLSGKRIDVQDRVVETTATARKVADVLSREFGAGNFFCPGTDDEDKKVWARSLADFFELGAKLQEAGKRPRVYISW